MRSSDVGNKPAPQQIRKGSPEQATIADQVTLEIGHLKFVLRNLVSTHEEKAITQSQIGDYHEIAVIGDGTSADWLQQIYLLADPDQDNLV